MTIKSKLKAEKKKERLKPEMCFKDKNLIYPFKTMIYPKL